MKKYTPATTIQQLAKQMTDIIQAVWHLSPESIRKAPAGKAKNGLTASGLLVCKGGDCQYKVICDITRKRFKRLARRLSVLTRASGFRNSMREVLRLL